ncbi:LPXTG cell wall anchor domain-containing protein [Staphylococcus hominis]|uniref:LPXTG cell wall anchor domain-containing protein n=1 Tax=Staphylococcus hominis TaxID=1290 RepID=UPI002DD6567B|nr:LPXTG cell wall anchor domain-containing protein [Staphylococcus hominis]WRY66712.1 LPXTG cell wall anchor domain-containing protein [Staphylococcus hominis]
MKKSKVLATTTLAGALLFTGVGATHHANAAENVTKSQAEESVKNFVTNSNDFNPASDSNYTEWHMDDTTNTYPVSNSYQIIFAEDGNQSPTPLYVKKDTGDIYDWNGNLLQKGSVSSENNIQDDQTTTSNTTQDTTNNNTQSTDNTQAATNNEATNNNTTAATDNNVSTQENNTQSTQSNETQTTTQALPETGEQSNSGLLTIIASVLLAAGSLLAFRRTSNSK